MNDATPFDALELAGLEQKACAKWQHHPRGVLPLWVADMDFAVAEPIKAALQEHLGGENFGYPPAEGLPGVKEAATSRLEGKFGWRLSPEQLHLLNGVVPGLFLSVLACTSEGEEVLMNAPIYGPFMAAVKETRRRAVFSEMRLGEQGYELDFERLEAAITPATRLLMLCNPHNPLGRVFRREELERLAELALRHRLWVVSDELHAELVYPGHQHLPFAALDGEIAQRTLTLFGPSKAFNLAGLKIGFAASANEQLLARFRQVATGLVGPPNVLAQVATRAAYQQGDAWLGQALAYLQGNRDVLAEFLAEELPQVKHVPPEGTYLAWLDFSFLDTDEVEAYLLERARVALNNGTWFGPGGAGFARLNFATSRPILRQALARIKDAVSRREKAA